MASHDLPATGGSSEESIAKPAEQSQTASEFIQSQLQLEADAREALPYQFDTCTKDLGPLRQNLFSCLTCNPPPSNPLEPYRAAGVCYACSISCHGEHELVELFTRRNFVCDCGTTRLPSTSTCSLRINQQNGTKGAVHDDAPATTNTYNQNFRNRFCGCREDYDAHTEKGTMFQCLGLGTVEDGGCGEDWWHPECILGLGRNWYTNRPAGAKVEEVPKVDSHTASGAEASNSLSTAPETRPGEVLEGATTEQEHPIPPGFPAEDDFEHLICYKCTAAFPWIKRYADAPGFLSGIPHSVAPQHQATIEEQHTMTAGPVSPSRKRKASESELDSTTLEFAKKPKADNETPEPVQSVAPHAMTCAWSALPSASPLPTTLFLKADFRDHLCRKCPTCFARLAPHPQLLEEEEVYEPPESSDGSEAAGAAGSVHSAGSRSLLDRGEAALSNMDRVRAIEGVMAYNHLRDKVKDFLKPFAETGKVVGAEDIKKYFEKLRGDEEAIRAAALGGGGSTDEKK